MTIREFKIQMMGFDENGDNLPYQNICFILSKDILYTFKPFEVSKSKCKGSIHQIRVQEISIS